jgi:hypothetical protein
VSNEDTKLAKAPEIERIRAHFEAIAKEMDSLRAKFPDRAIYLFAEGESGVHLMDNERDGEITGRITGGHMAARQVSVVKGGPHIASYTRITARYFSGGAW